MTIQELKEKLNPQLIKKLLLEEMNAELISENETQIIFNTVCHHGDSHKLYFYKETQSFYCFTHCGSMDIISLVINNKGYNPNEIQKAINYIIIKLNLQNFNSGFVKTSQISDWNFINKIPSKKKTETQTLKVYDPSVLKTFQKIYPQQWLNDGISPSAMDKYNILYDMANHRIIIPHYDINQNLIGVRCRALMDTEISNFGKYFPISLRNTIYKHPLGLNLYGLSQNINAITRKRKVMLVEAEKSVLQADSMFGDDNYTLAICGSNVSPQHFKILISLNITEVIIALDKQYEAINTAEYNKWLTHVKAIANKLTPYFTVYVLWDMENLLSYKDSPLDKGKETLLKLMEKKLLVTSN